MKIGDKVKVVKSFSGPGGSLPASTPFHDELLEITEQNINYVEDLLRGGMVELFTESKRQTIVYKDPDEDTDILPDSAKAGKRSRKRDIQPDGG